MHRDTAPSNGSLGATIRSYRLRLPEDRRSLRSVASAAGVTFGYFGEVERGGRVPSREVLRRMADVIGAPKRQLYALRAAALGETLRAPDNSHPITTSEDAA